MCGIAEAGLAISAISTVTSMAGQYIQGQQEASARKQSAAYNAQVEANNMAMQRQLEQQEIQKGVADRERQQRDAVRRMGESRATMGASGFEMDSGTYISLLAEDATEHQHDSNIITQNANQAAWSHQVAAVNAENDKAFARYQGKNAGSGTAGTLLGMGGTLLGGIGAGIGQYGKLRNTAGPGGSGGSSFLDRTLKIGKSASGLTGW